MLDPLLKLKEHIQEQYDEQIIIVSAYRDAEHQEDVLSSSKENVAAVVGASEHQYGLGIDIGVAGFGGRSFLKTETGRHVNRHCQEYGFIIRYPLCSSEKTGITYEPWHIRFVGLPHAEIIYKSGMVLEEYIESLTPYAYYEYDGYLISRQEPNNICIPAEFESCNLSLDNTGYCIVTLKTSH
jgi:D-alanyl-D-alanine carboxypeptidase